MKRARFTEMQIVAILKEVDSGIPVKVICRKYEISDATYYNWKSKYGGMEASDLKRMYADMALENRALKDLIEKNF
jgi:putative transposase